MTTRAWDDDQKMSKLDEKSYVNRTSCQRRSLGLKYPNASQPLSLDLVETGIEHFLNEQLKSRCHRNGHQRSDNPE